MQERRRERRGGRDTRAMMWREGWKEVEGIREVRGRDSADKK